MSEFEMRQGVEVRCAKCKTTLGIQYRPGDGWGLFDAHVRSTDCDGDTTPPAHVNRRLKYPA